MRGLHAEIKTGFATFRDEKQQQSLLARWTVSQTLATAKISTESGWTGDPNHLLNICSCSETSSFVCEFWNLLVDERPVEELTRRLASLDSDLEHLMSLLRVGEMRRGFDPWGDLATYQAAEDSPPANGVYWELPARR